MKYVQYDFSYAFKKYFSKTLCCSDGRMVAVKHIQNKHFTLSKTIRKEVKEVR